MATRLMTRKSPGQSLVEFTLSATLIFVILSATIDVGLAFFAYQGIAGAAQEGAAYAAYSPVTRDNNNNAIVNDAEVRSRVRNEAGVAADDFANRARFVSLHDLNNDKTDDSTQPAVLTDFIRVSSLANGSNPGGVAPCNDTIPIRTAQFCDMRVVVRYTYRPFFSAAGLLGAGEIELSATRQATISR